MLEKVLCYFLAEITKFNIFFLCVVETKNKISMICIFVFILRSGDTFSLSCACYFNGVVSVKGKVKVHPRTGHEGPEGK